MKSARLSLCLVVVLLGALRCNAFTWESCSGANAAIKLTKVEMTPDPPTANSLVKIRIQGTAGELSLARLQQQVSSCFAIAASSICNLQKLSSADPLMLCKLLANGTSSAAYTEAVTLQESIIIEQGRCQITSTLLLTQMAVLKVVQPMQKLQTPVADLLGQTLHNNNAQCKLAS